MHGRFLEIYQINKCSLLQSFKCFQFSNNVDDDEMRKRGKGGGGGERERENVNILEPAGLPRGLGEETEIRTVL